VYLFGSFAASCSPKVFAFCGFSFHSGRARPMAPKMVEKTYADQMLDYGRRVGLLPQEAAADKQIRRKRMDRMKTSSPASRVNSFRVEQAVSGETLTLTGTVHKPSLLPICVVATAA